MKSSKTGWEYNDITSGGFEYNANYEQETGPGLVFIEGGTFVMGRVDEDLRYDWNNIPRRVTVSSFYMDETEVTNVDYREYLYWLQRVYVSYPQVYQDALPDTLVWRNEMSFNEPLVEYYFRHPTYSDYPVVGVSWMQATNYCNWRTDRVNEMILIREGIQRPYPNQRDADNFNTDAYLAGQYQGIVRKNLPNLSPDSSSNPTRHVRLEDGIFLPKYRLPTEAEWEYAALGVLTQDGNSVDRKIYPWRGNYVRNPEKREVGAIMANFARGRGDMMGVAGSLNDAAGITSPVKSYWPNDYGLYDMAGNVNEWVMDVYRPLSPLDVDEFRPFRGNVFTVPEKDETGNFLEKDSLGRIKKRIMTDDENRTRRNYRRSDNRNYRDGDLRSNLDFNLSNNVKDEESTKDMYFQGFGEDQNSITSRITDKSRVYKGGSWMDRAYYLIPGTRRFLDENLSRKDIGFRCAMSRLGRETAK